MSLCAMGNKKKQPVLVRRQLQRFRLRWALVVVLYLHLVTMMSSAFVVSTPRRNSNLLTPLFSQKSSIDGDFHFISRAFDKTTSLVSDNAIGFLVLFPLIPLRMGVVAALGLLYHFLGFCLVYGFSGKRVNILDDIDADSCQHALFTPNQEKVMLFMFTAACLTVLLAGDTIYVIVCNYHKDVEADVYNNFFNGFLVAVSGALFLSKVMVEKPKQQDTNNEEDTNPEGRLLELWDAEFRKSNGDEDRKDSVEMEQVHQAQRVLKHLFQLVWKDT
jgi:hypothetical protein